MHAENLRTNISDEANLNFPILEFINTGVVDTLKKLLQPPYWDNQKLLTEVLWIFINFIAAATPEIMSFLINTNILECFIEILNFKQEIEVYENVKLKKVQTNFLGDMVYL